jgi:aryl carrier-like protein
MTIQAWESETLNQLRQAVADIIGLDPNSIPADANLIRLGIDSLGIMRLVNQWRREGIRVSSRVLTAEPTIAAWQSHLHALRQAELNEVMVESADESSTQHHR